VCSKAIRIIAGTQGVTEFTRDGKRLAFMEINPATGRDDIWTVLVALGEWLSLTGSIGARPPQPKSYTATSFEEVRWHCRGCESTVTAGK
jgi:hypothetical protein